MCPDNCKSVMCALKFWFFHKFLFLYLLNALSTPMAYWLWCYDASRKDSSLFPSTEKLVAQPQVTCTIFVATPLHNCSNSWKFYFKIKFIFQ